MHSDRRILPPVMRSARNPASARPSRLGPAQTHSQGQSQNPCRPLLHRLPHMPAQYAGIYGARKLLSVRRVSQTNMWATRPGSKRQQITVYRDATLHFTNSGSIFSSTVKASSYLTNAQCASSSGHCGTAPVGFVAVSSGPTSLEVLTKAVTANSTISVTFDSSVSIPGVTCSTMFTNGYITQRNPGSSFMLNVTATPPSGTYACFSYLVVN